MLKRITNNKITVRTLENFYDEIRMRDEEGHPKAYIDYGNFRIEFKRAALRNGYIEADARIFQR